MMVHHRTWPHIGRKVGHAVRHPVMRTHMIVTRVMTGMAVRWTWVMRRARRPMRMHMSVMGDRRRVGMLHVMRRAHG